MFQRIAEVFVDGGFAHAKAESYLAEGKSLSKVQFYHLTAYRRHQ